MWRNVSEYFIKFSRLVSSRLKRHTSVGTGGVVRLRSRLTGERLKIEIQFSVEAGFEKSFDTSVNINVNVALTFSGKCTKLVEKNNVDLDNLKHELLS